MLHHEPPPPTAAVEGDDPQAVSARYGGERGEQYWAWQRGSGARAVPSTVPFFRPHLSGRERLVDVGCGGGYLLEALPASERIGVEPNPSARAEATNRALDVRASLTEVPSGWADVAISNHALEHTLSPLAVLREARRVLRDGGRLVLLLPLDDWRTGASRNEPDLHGHLYTWTPQLLVNLLAEAGFEDVDSRVITRAIPPAAGLLRRVPPLYELAAWSFSVVARRRQTLTTATAS